MKILYFEGAGLSDADISKATIGNCRIRTAFHLDNGKAVYLEIVGSERTRRKGVQSHPWPYTGFVDTCHYISDDVPNDDENLHRIVSPNLDRFEYTEKAILRYVNRLGASFDAIKVVPDLGGYQVFPSNRPSRHGTAGYNYGDQFQYDEAMTARRQAVYDKIYAIEKEELLADRQSGEHKFTHPGPMDYPCFSLWVDESDAGMLHLVRHFNGYNKHWTIRTDVGDKLEDWMATMTETLLCSYGC